METYIGSGLWLVSLGEFSYFLVEVDREAWEALREHGATVRYAPDGSPCVVVNL